MTATWEGFQTILLDPLKSVKQLQFQLKYEFLPFYSVSLRFKIVIHRAEFSTLLTQITLLKMQHFGPTSELLALNTLKKKCPISLINNLSYVTRVEH